MDLGGPQKLNTADLINQQARANRVGTVSPFGSVTYYEDQGGPRNDTRAEIVLSEPQQQILDQQQRAQLLSGQTAVGRLGSFGDDAAASRAATEQAYFDRAAGLLRPEFDRREAAMQQRLANQGLPQTSGAYNREAGRFETGVNQAFNQLALEAVMQGGAEETRMLNQILALMGGAGQVQQPEIFAPGAVDVLRPYALNQDAAAQQQAFAGDIIGGLLGAGGYAAGSYLGRGG
jgi:hypothetical protein